METSNTFLLQISSFKKSSILKNFRFLFITLNFMDYISQSSFGYAGSTSEIYSIFRHHQNSLFDQRQKANQAIDEWSSGLAQQIKDHAFEQKRLVDQAYENQRKYLDDMRENFVATKLIYDRNNDNKEIDRLLDKCRSLKGELVELNFDPREKDFIRVTPIELSERMDQQEFSSNKTENDKFEKLSTERAVAASLFDKGSTSSSYSTATSATSDRVK
jgi:hypothetical protein